MAQNRMARSKGPGRMARAGALAAAGLALALGALSPANLAAQSPLPDFVITDGGTTLEFRNTVGFDNSPGAGGDTIFSQGAGPDLTYQHWYWFRADGDTREYALSNRTSLVENGNTAVLTYSEPIGDGATPNALDWRLTFRVHEAGPGQIEVITVAEVTNTTAGPVTLDVFAFHDHEPQSINASNIINQPNLIALLNNVTGPLQFYFDAGAGNGLNLLSWQIAAWPTILFALGDDSDIDNLTGTGVAGMNNFFQGAIQYRGTLPAGGSASFPTRFSLGIPSGCDVPPPITGCIVDPIMLTDADGSCDEMATWTEPTALSYCGNSISVVRSHAPGDLFPVGTTPVTYTFIDDVTLETSSCTFDVVVDDGSSPGFDFFPADTMVNCGDDTSPAALGEPTSDDCSMVSITSSDTYVPCTNMTDGMILREWTLDDGINPPVMQTQTITIVDTLAPVLTVPPNIGFPCGTMDVSPGVAGMATAMDLCNPLAGPPTFMDGPPTPLPSCGGMGFTFTRTWSVMDACGNTATSDQQITVGDVTAPTGVIIDVTPDPRNVAVDSIDIQFDEAVMGVDLSDFELRRGNTVLSLAGATLTGGPANYTLGNLTALTTANGKYTLTLKPGGISDFASNVLTVGDTDKWTMDATAPKATITFLPATQVEGAITGTISITDKGAAGITSRELFVRKAGGSWTSLGAPSGISFTYLPLEGSGIYYFDLRAVDGAGNESGPAPAGSTGMGQKNTHYNPTANGPFTHVIEGPGVYRFPMEATGEEIQLEMIQMTLSGMSPVTVTASRTEGPVGALIISESYTITSSGINTFKAKAKWRYDAANNANGLTAAQINRLRNSTAAVTTNATTIGTFIESKPFTQFGTFYAGNSAAAFP